MSPLSFAQTVIATHPRRALFLFFIQIFKIVWSAPFDVGYASKIQPEATKECRLGEPEEATVRRRLTWTLQLPVTLKKKRNPREMLLIKK